MNVVLFAKFKMKNENFFYTNLEFLLGGYEEAACRGSCRA